MMKLYGRPNSSNVQKVMWALDELQQTYDFVLAGAEHGITREPWFLAFNPNGLVPVLVDDDFALWESNAILRYLASSSGIGVLARADAKGFARADQWLDWSASTLGDDMRAIFFGLSRTPPAERDIGNLKVVADRLQGKWAVLDAHLADKEHVTGRDFSVADIPLAILASRWLALVAERPPAPNLERWMATVTARPSFRRCVPTVSIMNAP